MTKQINQTLIVQKILAFYYYLKLIYFQQDTAKESIF